MFSFLGFLGLHGQIEALPNIFKLKDFEGVWSIVGGSQGGVSGSNTLSVSVLGQMVIKKDGTGHIHSLERVSWAGPIGTAVKTVDIPFPLEITLELTRPDLGKGVMTIQSLPALNGPTVHVLYSFIVVKGDRDNKVERFYVHMTETNPVIPDLIPNNLPVFTVERQLKKSKR